MPGVFVDQFLQLEHQNTLFAGHTSTARYLVPFRADVTPAAATVYADLDVDTDYQAEWDYEDWAWTLPEAGQSKATLTHQFNFDSADEGVTYYGAALYAVIDAVPILMYAERFAVPFVVPAGGGQFVWQFNLFLQGACP